MPTAYNKINIKTTRIDEMIDKKDFLKLSPEERIKRLKQLEEERKKDASEIEVLIKESMQQLKTEKLAVEIAPEQKAVDISRLFEKGNGNKLERTAKRDAPIPSKSYMAIQQTYQDYSQLKSLYGVVSEGGELTAEQLTAIGTIGERLNKAEKYMTEGEKAASKLDASRAVLYKLRKETGIE